MATARRSREPHQRAKALLDERGCTAVWLADQIEGVTADQLRKWLSHGVSMKLTPAVIRQMASALDVSIDYIFCDDENMTMDISDLTMTARKLPPSRLREVLHFCRWQANQEEQERLGSDGTL